MVEKFLEEHGYPLKENSLLQDKTSAILMEEQGRACLGKCNRTIDVRFFAIKDHVAKGDVQIVHCPTDSMAGDFFTKPLQGERFRRFRKLILGM